MATKSFIVIFICVLSFCLLQIALLIRARKKIKKVKHQILIEASEAYFANARNDLMKLALDKKVDIQSNAFKFLYSFNTTLMRRPDQYQELSEILPKVLFNNGNKDKSDPFKIGDVASYPEDVKKIFKLTGDGIGHIVIEYSTPLRWIMWVLKRMDKDITHLHTIQFLKVMFAKEGQKVKAEKELKKAQKVFYNLSESNFGYGLG